MKVVERNVLLAVEKCGHVFPGNIFASIHTWNGGGMFTIARLADSATNTPTANSRCVRNRRVSNHFRVLGGRLIPGVRSDLAFFAPRRAGSAAGVPLGWVRFGLVGFDRVGSG